MQVTTTRPAKTKSARRAKEDQMDLFGGKRAAGEHASAPPSAVPATRKPRKPAAIEAAPVEAAAGVPEVNEVDAPTPPASAGAAAKAAPARRRETAESIGKRQREISVA